MALNRPGDLFGYVVGNVVGAGRDREGEILFCSSLTQVVEGLCIGRYINININECFAFADGT